MKSRVIYRTVVLQIQCIFIIGVISIIIIGSTLDCSVVKIKHISERANQ